MSTLTFYGGAGEVTGANIMLKTPETTILVDCGLHQGEQFNQDTKNRTAFQYDVASVDALLITHAHADHIGRIPFLVASGYAGPIYSTPETKALAQIVLEDAVHIFIDEEKRTGQAPLYTLADVDHALRQWKTVDFHTPLALRGCTATWKPIGHILGAGSITIERQGNKLLCTGDVGNVPDVLLPEPEIVSDATYLVTESVYGDRLHDDISSRSSKLRDEIIKANERGGTLIIPSFAVHRTQLLLYEIHELFVHAQAPIIPVFLDAPLAIRATEIYKGSMHLFKQVLQQKNVHEKDIFSFPHLTVVKTAAESAKINDIPGAKIIIAGSGMSVGGRVLSHEIDLLGDRKNAILFVGYQAPGTIGRRIQEGVRRVKIGDTYVTVRARVAEIHGYSGHADRDQLFDFARRSEHTLKRIFVIMGEPRSATFLAQRLGNELALSAVVPDEGESFDIDM